MTAILVTTNQSDKIITKLAQQTRSQYLCSHSNELLYIKLFDILHCIHPNVLHIVFINSINCVCKRYLFVWFRSCTISRPSRSLASAFFVTCSRVETSSCNLTFSLASLASACMSSNSTPCACSASE